MTAMVKLKKAVALALLAIMFVPSFAYCQNPNLSMEISPDKMTLVAGEDFSINARIINHSSTEQSVVEWVCSYQMDWIPDNSLIAYPPWGCDQNGLMKRTIAPGKFYERKITLHLSKYAKGTFSFKMKFAEGDDTTPTSRIKMGDVLISNPVSVSVDKERSPKFVIEVDPINNIFASEEIFSLKTKIVNISDEEQPLYGVGCNPYGLWNTDNSLVVLFYSTPVCSNGDNINSKRTYLAPGQSIETTLGLIAPGNTYGEHAGAFIPFKVGLVSGGPLAGGGPLWSDTLYARMGNDKSHFKVPKLPDVPTSPEMPPQQK